MRVAVIFFSGQKREKLMQLGQGGRAGHRKAGKPGRHLRRPAGREVRLTIYQYIVVGAEPLGTFGGKIPETARTFLRLRRERLPGKSPTRSFRRRHSAPRKSLSALMKSMEGEGMVIKTSDILRSAMEAEEIGTAPSHQLKNERLPGARGAPSAVLIPSTERSFPSKCASPPARGPRPGERPRGPGRVSRRDSPPASRTCTGEA